MEKWIITIVFLMGSSSVPLKVDWAVGISMLPSKLIDCKFLKQALNINLLDPYYEMLRHYQKIQRQYMPSPTTDI